MTEVSTKEKDSTKVKEVVLGVILLVSMMYGYSVISIYISTDEFSFNVFNYKHISNHVLIWVVGIVAYIVYELKPKRGS